MKKLVFLGIIVGFLTLLSYQLIFKKGSPLPVITHSEHKDSHGDSHGDSKAEKHEEEDILKISDERIKKAQIEITEVKSGKILKNVAVTGAITLDKNKTWRVAARVNGTILSLTKGVSDTVTQGDLLAIIESREVAEAKSDYASAVINLGLQKTLFERSEALWRNKIQAEQQYLIAKENLTQSELKLSLSRQKLIALGVAQDDLKKISVHTMSGIQKYEIKSPANGKIIERLVDNGAPVGGEGQAKELYVIADLSQVWLDIAINPNDLPSIKEGQEITLQPTPQRPDLNQTGKIVFINPVLDPVSRAAHVVASFSNHDNTLRPGIYVSGNIAIENAKVDMLLPKTAFQTIKGATVVFIRNKEGFDPRKVIVGKDDGINVEVISGVDPGDSIAVQNTFLLKAELGKSEAEHSH